MNIISLQNIFIWITRASKDIRKNIKMLFNIKVLVLILTIIINLSDCQFVKYVIEVSCLNTDIFNCKLFIYLFTNVIF